MLTNFTASYPYLSGALTSIIQHKQKNDEFDLDENDFINFYIKNQSPSNMQHINDQLGKIWHECNNHFIDFNIDISQYDYWSTTNSHLLLNVHPSIFKTCISESNPNNNMDVAVEKWVDDWNNELQQNTALIAIKLDDLFKCDGNNIQYQTVSLLNILDFLNLCKNKELIFDGEKDWQNTVQSIDTKDIQSNCLSVFNKLFLSSLKLHFNLTKALGGVSDTDSVNDLKWLLNAYNQKSDYLSKIGYTCRPYNQLYSLLFAKTLLEKEIAHLKNVEKLNDNQFLIKLCIPTEKWIGFYKQKKFIKDKLILSNTNLDLIIHINQDLHLVKNLHVDIDSKQTINNFSNTQEGLVCGFSNQYQNTWFNVNNFWWILGNVLCPNYSFRLDEKDSVLMVRKALFDLENTATSFEVSNDFIKRALKAVVENSDFHLKRITLEWNLENKKSQIIQNGQILTNTATGTGKIGKWQFNLADLNDVFNIPHFEKFKQKEYKIHLLTDMDWDKLKNQNDIMIETNLNFYISLTKNNIVQVNELKNIDLIFVEFESKQIEKANCFSDLEVEMFKIDVEPDNQERYCRIYGLEKQWGKIPPHVLFTLLKN